MGRLAPAKAIMMIMHVLEEEFLCQGLTGWILVLECLFVRCGWITVSYVPSYARP
jgi:hypothetical protein